MGYREERGKVEAGGKTVTREAWEAGLEAKLPPSRSLTSVAHARPAPSMSLVPRVLESVSPAPGRGLFSQLLVPSAQCEGSSCPRLLECAQGVGMPDTGQGQAAPRPEPLTPTAGGWGWGLETRGSEWQDHETRR